MYDYKKQSENEPWMCQAMYNIFPVCLNLGVT